ncbi:MAG: CbiQ family ECF transporter T component [Bifidobacterium sp.]|nr:CbiQ family ECF transporter T component [Bifidobacterium sp.]
MSEGFYARGDGWLHKLDTRVKALLALVLVVCVAMWGNWMFLAGVFILLQLMFITDRTPGYAMRRCWAGLGPVLLIVFVVLLLTLNDFGGTVVWQVGWWRVTAQALALNGCVLLRIADIALSLLMVLLTTSDEQWTRGLAAVRVPFPAIHRWLKSLHEIPGVFVNAKRSRLMQAARGASMGLGARIRSWIEAWHKQAMRNDDIDTAMRTRGIYLNRHGAKRTLANPAHMRLVDWLVLLLTLCGLAGVIMAMVYGW